jgi:hypothetical protein
MKIVQSYAANRDRFCTEAMLSGARLYSIPYEGDLGAGLTTDVAVMGNDDAQNVVVVSSGLHGVELPAGSLVQFLGFGKIRNRDLKDTKFIFVHALNPYGAQHALRTDRGPDGGRNIDPARNFMDFAAPDFVPAPADPAIENAMKKASLSGHSLAMMWARLLHTTFVRLGQTEFKRRFVCGQYTNPLVPYYGGRAACYTRLTWEKIVREEIIKPAVRKIYHLDCHTGDGPFGALQLYLCSKAGEKTAELACKLINPDRVQSVDEYFANITGDIGDYWGAFGLPPDVEIYPLTLEFGTTQAHIPGVDILGAILNRTLLAEKYDDDHPEKEVIIQNMKTAFCPVQEDWEKSVISQSKDVWDRLLLSMTL